MLRPCLLLALVALLAAADPVLVFAFANERRDAAACARLLADPRIDGIVAGDSWDRLEAVRGSHDWSRIDAALTEARRAGKQATLHLFPAYFGRPPAWLRGSGAAFFRAALPGGRAVEAPVPWDGVFLDHWSALISALAAHLDATGLLPAVHAISVAAPVPEMTMAWCRDGRLGDVVYDRAAYLAAWKRMVGVYHRALPGVVKLVCAPHEGHIAFQDGDAAFFREVMAEARPLGRFSVFATDLTAQGSRRCAAYAAEIAWAGLGVQTIWSASRDPQGRMRGTLAEAFARGRDLGAGYVEVYQDDVESADPAIRAAIDGLRRPAP